ncbi:YjbH domain-containing protein [Rubellimicrobium sp. CFH 75288]|uniref:YjbH domain-containing protein n=1 Tax=Rubellimicrobium sp. CFH 75288 TaxID=2697034 RepID=UPI001412447F|nr:YjbH domain-containing protein [Rubellimicrobium sp. CFH 75288]NAZ38044.1 YjbH domain-containing protein [Rubellimicrobium sp. CFH 75288]
MARSLFRPLRAASALALAVAVPAGAQDGTNYTLYGTPGLIEMPSAISAPDGQIAGTLGWRGRELRNSFTFQVTPRLSGTFRYAGIDGYAEEGEGYWDRSFDLRFRLTDEGPVMPAIAIGLQDFLGTGLYASEYLVATKTIGSAFRVTTGLGWGRLGTYNGFTNPLGALDDRFEERPVGFLPGDPGGTPSYETFFRGDAALFGGIEWAPNERWIVTAEYSSDDGYTTFQGEPLFERRTPLNFGVAWTPLPGIQLGLGYLYGSELAFRGTITVNPNDRPFLSGLDPAPLPVAVRADGLRAAQSWDRAALPESTLRDRLTAAMRAEGVELAGLELTDRTARVRYTNTRYRSEAQAMGRIARILTRELPPSIERLTLEPMQRGIPLSAVTFARSDIEDLENRVGGTAASLARAEFDDAGPSAGLTPVPSPRDPFSWGVRPYFGLTLFNAGSPIQFSAGAELSAAYRIQPNLILSGAVRQRVISSGLRDLEPAEPIAGIPVVRRDQGLYGRDGHPVLQTLTLSHYGRPGRDLYSRVTAGYLEAMYGGVSGELLYAPVSTRWALGAEINYAVQRDFDMLLGFRDYDTVTGHASLYYDLGNGFHAQVDAGRYLAGDWGATLAVDREFENGWRVGAYATLTDIPFEDFGEGSFDKGIRFTVPIDFVLGRPTRRDLTNTIRSLNRDGGARLNVEGRLYEVVRGGRYADLEDTWGRFWR